MPRVPKTPIAAQALLDWVGPEPSSKSTRKRNGAKALASARRDLETIRESGSWASAQPRHFVALYAWLHETVYGVAPAELGTDAFFGAVSAAGKLLRDEFGDRPEALVEFLRWTWRRERAFEKKRRLDGEGGRRIGWRLQFVLRHLLTDYRLDLARAGARLNGSRAS